MSDCTSPRSRLHRRKDASAYLEEKHGIRLSNQTLAKYAVTGDGPEIIYDGPFPLYSETALDAFAATRLRGPFKSTSERRLAA